MAEYQPGYDGLPVSGKGLPHSTAAQAPRRMAKPFEWATRRSRVGTGVGAMRPGCRQSDEKVPSRFPEKPLITRPRSGCLRLQATRVESDSPDQTRRRGSPENGMVRPVRDSGIPLRSERNAPPKSNGVSAVRDSSFSGSTASQQATEHVRIPTRRAGNTAHSRASSPSGTWPRAPPCRSWGRSSPHRRACCPSRRARD